MAKYPAAAHIEAMPLWDIANNFVLLLKFCVALPTTLVCSGAQFPSAERGLSLFSPETYRYICHDGCAVKTHQLRGATPSAARDSDGMKPVNPYWFKYLTHGYYWLLSWDALLPQWLNEEKLAQRLIELIHPERDEEVKEHVSPSDSWETKIRMASSTDSASNGHFPLLSFTCVLFCDRGSPTLLRLCVTSFV